MNAYFMRLSPDRLIPVEFYDLEEPRLYRDADGFWIAAVYAEDALAAIEFVQARVKREGP